MTASVLCYIILVNLLNRFGIIISGAVLSQKENIDFIVVIVKCRCLHCKAQNWIHMCCLGTALWKENFVDSLGITHRQYRPSEHLILVLPRYVCANPVWWMGTHFVIIRFSFLPSYVILSICSFCNSMTKKLNHVYQRLNSEKPNCTRVLFV